MYVIFFAAVFFNELKMLKENSLSAVNGEIIIFMINWKKKDVKKEYENMIGQSVCLLFTSGYINKYCGYISVSAFALEAICKIFGMNECVLQNNMINRKD